MRKLIFGLVLGTAFSIIISRLKEENNSCSGSIADLSSLNNIGAELKLPERYKLHRMPYKDLSLVNDFNR